MKFNYGKALLIFFVGFIISVTVGAIFNDAGMASVTAICYVGAIIGGLLTKK